MDVKKKPSNGSSNSFKKIIALLITLLLISTYVSIVAAFEGDITASVIETFNFDTSGNTARPSVIWVSGEIYAVVYQGESTDGYVKTFSISSTGDIGAAVIDTLEFDTSDCVDPDIIRLGTSNYYAVAYQGESSDGYIKTFTIDSSGNIGDSVNSTYEFDTAQGASPDIEVVNHPTYAVVYSGPDNDGFIFTVNISSTGVITASKIDTLEFDTADGVTPDLERIAGTNYYVIAYSGALADGFVGTVEITSAGQIGAARIDYLEFDTSNCVDPDLVRISSDVWAVAYTGPSVDGWLATFTISPTDGAISNSNIDSFEWETSNGQRPSIRRVSGDAFAISYEGVGADGFLCTVSVTTAGDIGASTLDSWEWDTSDGQGPHMFHVSGDYWAIAYKGSLAYGKVITFKIETAPDVPTSITATAVSKTQINIAWTKGSGDRTVIVAKQNSYPTSRTDGSTIYNNTGTAYNHTGLSPGQAWYYCAWSYNSTSKLYSETYAQDYDTTFSNSLPNFGTPSPTNNSINQNTSLTWSISINDTNGDTFSWWINCSNGNTSSASGATNGTKQLSISGLSYSTKYKVWVNATDSYGWTRAWYNFTTKGSPNSPPDAPDPAEVYPTNGSTGIPIEPTVTFWANDTDGNTLTVTLYYSSNGVDWTYSEQQEYVPANTTIYWSFTEASGYETLYYWKVAIDDGVANTTAIFHFTTEESQPIITEPSTGDNLIYPYEYLFYPSSDTGYNYWHVNTGSSAHYTYVNETTPDYNSTYLWASTSVPDEWYNIPDHTSQTGPIANVTIYVCARSISGSPQIQIHCINGTLEYGDYSGYLDVIYQWSNFSYVFTHPPTEEREWTWEDIDNLWIGFGKIAPGNVSVTQCYAIVNYGNPYINYPFNMSINISEPTGKPMNVTMWTNASGAWEVIEDSNYTDVGNGTYYAPANIFNGYNETYWWSVNVSTENGWTNTTYSFTTQPAPNKVPFVEKDFYPGTTAIAIPTPVRCRVTIHDDEMNIMTLYWRTNASGDWETFGMNYSAVNGTYYQDFPYNEEGKKYWWSVNISNEGHWSNTTNSYVTEQDMPKTWWNENYTYVKRIDINHSMFTENLSYFPLLVHLIDSNFSHSQSDGDDFVFIANDNTTQLSYEFEEYNYTTNELLVWVNIPFISETVDTTIWLYFGNSTCGAHEDIEGTWNEDYVLVHHYQDNSLLDSTAYNHDGTNDDTSYYAIGKIAGCRQGYDSVGGAATRVYVNNFVALQTYITAEMWIYIDTTTANTQLRIFQEGNRWARNDWAMQVRTDHNTRGFEFRVNGAQATRGGDVPGTNGEGFWWYVAGRIDVTAQGDYVDMFSNTTKKTLSQFLQNIPNGYTTLNIAGDPFLTSASWKGYFDEARISKVPRSWAWLNTSYGNQNDPDAYINEHNTTTLDDSLFINVTPTAIDFGNVDVGTTANTDNYHFNLTNHGIRCNVDMEMENSNNWTYVNYSEIGFEKFSMNYSDDDWTSEKNIEVGGTNIAMHMNRDQVIGFDLKVIMPLAISKIYEQAFTVTLIITPD